MDLDNFFVHYLDTAERATSVGTIASFVRSGTRLLLDFDFNNQDSDDYYGRWTLACDDVVEAEISLEAFQEGQWTSDHPLLLAHNVGWTERLRRRSCPLLVTGRTEPVE